MVSYQRQLQQAEKTQEAQRLLDAINGILSLHRQDFLPVQPPVAAAAAPVNEGQIRARHEKQALSGIGLLKRAERKAAKAYAARSAETEIEAEQQRLVQERAEEQEQLDRWWQALLANHPATVLEFIVAAFEDNEAPAAPLSLQGDGLSVVVAVPPPDGLPERIPDRTAAGNLTLRKMKKAESNELYASLVCGYLLVTVREAFAVAPGVQSVRVAVLRASSLDSYGRPRVEALLAARFDRQAFVGVEWDRATSLDIFRDTATELLANLKTSAAGVEFRPLDVQKEPDLAALLDAADVEELVG